MNDERSTGRGSLCRNCGQPAGPKFCGACGQELQERRGSLLHIGGDLLSEWFSLDGRLMRTLRLLVRPGRLTNAYQDGKRVSHLAPFRLYLLASVLLFSSLLNLQAPDAAGTTLLILGEPVVEAPAVTINGARTSRTLEFLNADNWLARLIGSRFDEQVEELKSQPPQEVMDAVFDAMRRLLPTSLILFVPFLAAAIKLLYIRTGRLFVDHLIFAIHLQSALFLTLTAAWAIARIAQLGLLASGVVYALTGLAFIAVYLPLALHRVYQQSKWLTAFKTGALLYCYMQLLGLVISLPAIYVLWRM